MQLKNYFFNKNYKKFEIKKKYYKPYYVYIYSLYSNKKTKTQTNYLTFVLL